MSSDERNHKHTSRKHRMAMPHMLGKEPETEKLDREGVHSGKLVGTTEASEERWLEEGPSRKKEQQVPIPYNGTLPTSRSIELTRAVTDESEGHPGGNACSVLLALWCILGVTHALYCWLWR